MPDTWRYFGIVNFWNHFDSTAKNPLWMVKFMSIACECQSPNIPDLTKLRLTLFEKLSKSKTDADIDRCLPPSAKALLPHMQRAAYQTIISRKSCSAPPVMLPDPTKFGWKKEGSNFVPLMFSENQSSSRGKYEENSDSNTEEAVTDEYSSDSESTHIDSSESDENDEN